jgi:hypothetical protein
MYFCLGPFEWGGVLIPTGYKGFDGFDQHAHAGEACPRQGATAQDAKPAFNLVKPGAVGRNKMKMYVGGIRLTNHTVDHVADFGG